MTQRREFSRSDEQQMLLFAASFGGDVGQCFVRAYPDRVSKLILLNTGIPDEQLGRATRRGKPLVSLPPLGIVRFLVQKLLLKALSVRPEEQLFWQAMLHELVVHLTRADMVSTFDETIDYRLNYHFSPADLATWPGNVLIFLFLATQPHSRWFPIPSLFPNLP